MDKSTILIGLCLGTLLIGLGIAIYQLWSADKSKEQSEHSALAARFAGKPVGGHRYPTDDVLTPDPRGHARGMHSISDPEQEMKRAQPGTSGRVKTYSTSEAKQERVTPMTAEGELSGSVQPASTNG